MDVDSIEDLEAYVLFVSSEFLHDLNFEIVVLNTLPFKPEHSDPCMILDSCEMEMIVSYMNLLDMNAMHNESHADKHLPKSISRSLLTATFYQLMIFGMRRIGDMSEKRGGEASAVAKGDLHP